MKFNVSSNLNYTANFEGTIILDIFALQSAHQRIIDEAFIIQPFKKFDELISAASGSRLIRFDMQAGETVEINYRATVDNAWKLVQYEPAKNIGIDKLDASILPYLYPSRYCQCDKLSRLASNLFGKLADPFDQVLTIVDWIYQNVKYVSGSSTFETSAYDTAASLIGVCKDFAHLGIAFCRALDIPARYVAAYSYLLIPQDFHACFEAYLGGEWILFDATRLVPLNGLVKIAIGRDAAEVSVANMFGDIMLNSMTVNCDLAGNNFEPVYYPPYNHQGVSYL